MAEAIHKTDALSKETNVYERFSAVLATKRGDSESLKNFETRFDPQMPKLHSVTGENKFPEFLVSCTLLNNSNIEKNQRVTVIASCAPKCNANQSDVLKAIKFVDIASILRSCDAPHKASYKPVLTIASAKTWHTPRNTTKGESTDDRKKRSTCMNCGELGRWGGYFECKHSKRTHKSEKKQDSSEIDNGEPQQRALHFSMVKFLDNTAPTSEPMVDDGAPYNQARIFD